jgi:glyoxylase-like metal-dependent hydrolase (beta-lactamase superfamily II)
MLERLVVVGPFQCNCRLLACPRTGHALLVDPGDEPAKILKSLEGVKVASGAPIEVKYLLHTHGHLDHVGGTREVKSQLEATERQRREGGGAPLGGDPAVMIALHRGDEPLYRALQEQGRLFGIEYDEPLPIDHFLEDGEDLKIGDLKLSVIHTPGHSPGSVCFRLHEDSAAETKETLFSGDTLFQGSVGRTDLWGGDQDLMFRNIRERILTLDGDTRVCPGHGPDTRVGVEKKGNPFLT